APALAGACSLRIRNQLRVPHSFAHFAKGWEPRVKIFALLVRKLDGGALVHDVDPARPRGLNFVLLKAFLDSPSQFAAHSVLLVGARLYLEEIFHLAIADAIDPRHFNVADNIIGVSWIMS